MNHTSPELYVLVFQRSLTSLNLASTKISCATATVGSVFLCERCRMVGTMDAGFLIEASLMEIREKIPGKHLPRQGYFFLLFSPGDASETLLHNPRQRDL